MILNKDVINHECLPLTLTEVKKIIAKNEMRRLAKETFLNNNKIIF